MQGCMQGLMNLNIWRCKDSRIQASTRTYKDMKMQTCKDTKTCTET